jgi:hypothetical protein
MTDVKPLVVAAVMAATVAAPAAAQVPVRGSVSSLTTYTFSGETAIRDGAGRRAVFRARYVLPRTWRRTTPLRRRSVRFATGTSCRHRLTMTARVVEAPDVPAAERAAALTPAPATHVRAIGTREDAAFRAVRVPGSADVRGALVQPLSPRFSGSTPQGRRVYSEIVARAKADPRRECHAGAPRRVADALGDAFGAGSAGGFVLAAVSH